MITTEEEKQMYEDCQKAQDEYDQKWIDAKDELEDLIHPKYFDFIEEHDTYHSEGIVETIETEEKRRGYENYKHCRIKSDKDKLLYIYHTDEIESIQIESEYEGEEIEYYVWQTTGYSEDDYSGFLLLPLLDGRFWKVGYSC